MAYLIGIDAGGSSTKVVAYSTNGTELFRCQGRSANPAASGIDAAFTSFQEVIGECRNKLGDDIAHILIGAAGVETGQIKDQLGNQLQHFYSFPVRLISDALLVLEARLGANDGIVIISGTGSIAWGRHGSRLHRVGGWGHLIGDCGSGYAIAVEAIRGMAWQIDHGLPFDQLGQAILKELQFSGWPDLVNYVYSSDKAGIASLLPLLENLVMAGNLPARQLFNQAAVQLAEMVFDCAAVLNLNSPDIVASGSILQRIPYIQEKFSDQLYSKIADCTVNFQSIDASQAVIYSYQQIAD